MSTSSASREPMATVPDSDDQPKVYPYGQTPPGPATQSKRFIQTVLAQDARNHTRKLADIIGVYPC